MNYEQMVNYPNNFWLKHFMNLGCNVVVWNYRGFGCATGNPTPDRLRSDASTLFNFLKDELQLKGKFGAYGLSLGGLASTYLANTHEEIELLFADRTFANLKVIAQNKMHGKIMHHFWNFATLGWKAQNDLNFYQANTQCKILSIDPADDVIDTPSSLCVGVALQAAKEKHGEHVTLDNHTFVLTRQELKQIHQVFTKYFEFLQHVTEVLREDEVIVKIDFSKMEVVEEPEDKQKTRYPNSINGRRYKTSYLKSQDRFAKVSKSRAAHGKKYLAIKEADDELK